MHKYTSDGELKQMILTAIDSGCLKSRQIFNYIDYPDYKTFTVEMANLRRRGYLTKSGIKPFDFSMTKKGLYHFQNPEAFKEYKNIKHTLQFNKFIENQPEFQRAVAEYSSRMNHSPNSTIISPHNSPNQPSQDFGTGDNIDNPTLTEYQKTIDEQNAEIKELKNRNFNLNNHIQNQNQEKPITPAQQRKNKKISDLEIKRKDLVKRYADHYRGYDIQIDNNFFKIWENMNAYLFRRIQMFKKGSIEILSSTNMEIQRGHVKHALNDEELYKGNFRIDNITKTGIWIYGSGMNEPKFLKYNNRTKEPQKYWIK